MRIQKIRFGGLKYSKHVKHSDLGMLERGSDIINYLIQSVGIYRGLGLKEILDKTL